MLKQRIIYGYPLGALAVGIMLYGNFAMFLVLAVLSLVMLMEFYQLTGLRQDRKFFPMRRWGYILALTIFTLVQFKLTMYLDLAIVVFIMAAFIYRMSLFPKKSDGFLRDMAISIMGGIYIGGFLSYFMRLRDLGIVLKTAGVIPVGSGYLGNLPLIGNFLEQAGWTSGVPGGLMSLGPNWLVILAFCGSWGYDFSALFTGMLLGKTKLAPSISPKKTIEGMVGGLIGSATSIVLIAMFIGINPRLYLYLFVLGLILGTFSQLGDLCISSIKRDAGAKDSAARGIPGHGGLLDKCDGMLFVLPVAYYAVYFAALIFHIPVS